MFCVYCGTKMHDNGKFCPQCGKPAVLAATEPAKEVVAVEESTPVKEEAVEKASAEEKIVTVISEETADVEESTPVKEEAAEKTTAEEKIVTVISEEAADVKESTPVKEEAAEKTTAEEKKNKKAKAVKETKQVSEKKSSKKGLVKKNITSSITYLISAAIVAGIGLFAIPNVIFPAVIEKCAESSESETSLTLYKASGDSKSADDVKFDIAKSALEDENYAYAAALFSELNSKGYDEDADITSYTDEAFGGRCRVLVNGGKYNLAEADSTQISDELLRASIANDTIISKAKILSSEGKPYEAYEKISEVNTSAAYDSESFNIILYNYAAELYNEMKFAEAYDVVADATDEDSVELRRSCAYHLANDLLNAKDYSKAIEMYEKADGYDNSAEKIEQCHYMLGLTAYNTNDYQTAVEHFGKSGNYKESAEYLKKAEQKLGGETYSSGWTIDGHATNYVNPTDFGSAGEMLRISKNDDFIAYFLISNANINTPPVTVDVEFTAPDGEVVKETIENVNPDDICYASFGYGNPEVGATGNANFTVKISETGEVLGTFYFEIY